MKKLTLIKDQLNLKNNKLEQNKLFKSDSNIKNINPFKKYLSIEELKYLEDFKTYTSKKLQEKLYYYHETETVPIDVYRDIVNKYPESLNGMITDNNFIKKHCSRYLNFAINIEIGKIEPSLLGTFLVHGRLNLGLVIKYCNSEQKSRLIPQMINLNVITSFCLTEKDIGSEAHNLKTTFEEITTKDNDSYFILNGNKKWIGNADIADYLIVFAKNINNHKHISGFLVQKQDKGLEVDVIKSKLSLKIIHNCNIKFNNVKVNKINHISNIKSFNDVSACLVESRLYLCVVGLGLLIGEFEKVINYVYSKNKTVQFINLNLLEKYKLLKIYSKIESISAYLERLIEISYIKDLNGNYNLNQGLISMSKFWIGETIKEGIRNCMELFDRNGILFENSIKALSDVEALNIVEGTTDINLLAAGKHLTKISSYYR